METTHYKLAGKVVRVLEVLGSIVVLFAILGAVAAFINGLSWSFGHAFLSMLPFGGGVISGLFMIVGAQITRAAIDTADNTRRIYEELKQNKD